MTNTHFVRRFVAAIVVIAISSAASFAANPGFPGQNNPSYSVDGTEVTVDFKIAGLGNNEQITVVVEVDAVVQVVAINPGGHNPPGQQIQVTGTESGDFTSGRNGQVTDSLTVDLADAAAGAHKGNRDKWDISVVVVAINSVTVTVHHADGTLGPVEAVEQ